ncbi:MAG TPA: hypothetical protein VGG51_06155 [Candidatus Cybelea sp.]|jgi:hypothetical protein
MKINLLTAGALAVALAVPVSALAQQSQQPGAQTRHQHTTPSAAKIQHRWMKRFGHLNLSGDQQQRIQSMVDQYSQSHPAGSPVDRNATKELHRQIMGVLSSDQQGQYQQERQAHRAQMQRRGQGQGANYQGQNPQQQPQGYQGQPDQGQPDQGQQYQGQPNQGPPEQGPPEQGPPEQGPPPNQGPPQGQAPPDQQPPA